MRGSSKERQMMIQKHGSALTPVLVEPIFRRQPEEQDREYRFFLVYRDIAWEDRTLKNATFQIFGRAVNENPIICEFSARWQWAKRADAYDLFLQEERSDKNERLVQETKSEIEMLVYKLVKKIRSVQIAADQWTEGGEKQESIMKDMAVLETLIGKGNAGRFLLDSYKTLVGEKLQVSGKVSHLVWGS